MREELYNYLVLNSSVLTLQEVLLNFFIAVVLSIMIFVSYRISHLRAVYSVRFNISLLMLTLITTLVMSVIGNNIALSLGMVGALSIVRFRTAIKDPRDTAYIFWSIAGGICCGVSEYIIALIGTLIIFLVMLFFGKIQNNERYLLVIRANREQSKEIEELINSAYAGKAILKVRNSTNQSVEFIYELSQQIINKYAKDVNIAENLYQLEGVNSVNLVCQNDEINQ